LTRREAGDTIPLMNNELVDLHMHTNFSDGTWPVPVLLKKLVESGITFFSVTDHNNLEAHDEVRRLLPAGMAFVPGVEVSTRDCGTEYHMTCYGPLRGNKPLEALLAKNRKNLDSFALDMISFFGRLNNRDWMEEFKNYSFDRSRGGWKSLGFLVDKGVVRNHIELFKMLEGNLPDCDFIHPAELVEAVAGSGILVFLAHPPAYAKDDVLEKGLLDRFRGFGINGIECFNCYYRDQARTAYYLDYCVSNGLLVSGGSDCHGDFVGRTLGFPSVTRSQISFERFAPLANPPSAALP
jgi:3',5'-nucleoside bisphosphate phosphatase